MATTSLKATLELAAAIKFVQSDEANLHMDINNNNDGSSSRSL